MTNKFSFTKNHRIKKRAEFFNVLNKGKRLYSYSLIVYFIENDLENPRIGITISKKVSKLAVKRNKLKRIAREVFRLNQHKIKNVDIIIIFKRNSIKLLDSESYKELEKQFLNTLSSENIVI